MGFNSAFKWLKYDGRAAGSWGKKHKKLMCRMKRFFLFQP
jgi:hypothetical protein